MLIVTCIRITIPVQCCELFAVMPCEGVSSVAMVAAHSQSVVISFGLQSEAGILCKHFPATPVLQRDQQFVRSLVRQPVDVFQTKPILAIDVAKPLLRSAVIKNNNRKIRKSSLNVLRTEQVVWMTWRMIQGNCSWARGSFEFYLFCCCQGTLIEMELSSQVESLHHLPKFPLLFYYWKHSGMHFIPQETQHSARYTSRTVGQFVMHWIMKMFILVNVQKWYWSFKQFWDFAKVLEMYI